MDELMDKLKEMCKHKNLYKKIKIEYFLNNGIHDVNVISKLVGCSKSYIYRIKTKLESDDYDDYDDYDYHNHDDSEDLKDSDDICHYMTCHDSIDYGDCFQCE